MKKCFKAILSVVLVTILLVSLVACGGAGAGRGDTSANTIDWDSDFFGTTIPSPDDFPKASKFNKQIPAEGNGWATITIDGMSYKDFVDYCEKLEALPGWTSEEGKAVSDFPETEDIESRTMFEGSLPTIDNIGVYYYSKDLPNSDGNSYIGMFVYETWS